METPTPKERKCMYCENPAQAWGKRLCPVHLAAYRARSSATHASGQPERQRAAAMAHNARIEPNALEMRIGILENYTLSLLRRIETLERKLQP